MLHKIVRAIDWLLAAIFAPSGKVAEMEMWAKHNEALGIYPPAAEEEDKVERSSVTFGGSLLRRQGDGPCAGCC